MNPQTNSAYEPDDQNLYNTLTFRETRKCIMFTIPLPGNNASVLIYLDM